jgi:hypothetical protein
VRVRVVKRDLFGASAAAHLCRDDSARPPSAAAELIVIEDCIFHVSSTRVPFSVGSYEREGLSFKPASIGRVGGVRVLALKT